MKMAADGWRKVRETLIDTDKKGNVYIQMYGEANSKAVLSHKGKNRQFVGKPKFTFRKGKSKFGDELIIQFNIAKLEAEYPANSNHQTMEIYLPLEDGISLIEDAIDFYRFSTPQKQEEEK